MDDLGLLRLAEAQTSDLTKNKNAILVGRNATFDKVSVATWFLPVVDHALKGGVRTVFTFAEGMSLQFNTLNVFVIFSYTGKDIDVSSLERSLADFFPNLNFIIIKFINGKSDVSNLPYSQISFCTLWTTAYLLLKYNQTLRKYYFMQDYEPLFYEAGSLYAAIEQTYRFGFGCIANTPGVGERYLKYSDDVTCFYPGVDLQVFNNKGPIDKKARFQVVFYGRPGNPRNCFSLGVLTLKALKRKMKHHVQIYSVGADWDTSEYGLDGVLDNLGLLGSLEEVAKLYRNSDLGLVFMVTPHPSYQPFEYMACGCAVATNINESNSWYLNDQNSLQLEPIPEIAAQKMCDLLVDEKRLNSLKQKGMDVVRQYTWDNAFNVFKSRVLK